MERRDMLKGMALSAVTATAAGTAQAQSKPESVGVVDIVAAGGRAAFLYGDVGEAATCERMVGLCVERFGGLDLAINNAGVMDGVLSGDPVQEGDGSSPRACWPTPFRSIDRRRLASRFL